MKSIVIIPTYNERDNIAEIVPMIFAQLPNEGISVLVVDSASPDGTAAVVKEMQKINPKVLLFEQPRKLGLGKAYLDGMTFVLARDYDLVMTMDADFSHHPRYLPDMLREIQNADLVIGSRYVEGGQLKSWPWHRRALSKFANWYAHTLTGMPLSDLTAGFHCYRAPLLKKILQHPITTEGYAFQVEMKYWALNERARTREIPILFKDRTKGSSKISRQVIFECMIFVLKLALTRKRIKNI